MVLSEEDKHIRSLRENKQVIARRFLTEFLNKDLTRNGLDYLMKKIDAHAAVKRLSGSGRPRTACTADNVVQELVRSSGKSTQTHRINPNTPNHFEYKLELNRVILKSMTLVI